MTVNEMMRAKYEEWLQKMTEKQWKNIKAYAEAKKMSIPDYMMMCIEITENDANPRKNPEVYWELIEMNNQKLIASNRHRQEYGHIDRFWFTKNGLKQYNEQFNK